MSYVGVAKDDQSEVVDIPLEEDSTLLLSSLDAQFVGAIGLKYRNEENDRMRGLRVRENAIEPPEGGWGSRVYLVVTGEAKSSGGASGSGSSSVGVAATAAAAAGASVTGGNSDETGAGSKRKADDDDDSRKGKRSQVCYRCGGEGHIAEMCPSPDGSRQTSSIECHMCRGRGHVRMQCPNAIPRGVCYRCGIYGHTGKECMYAAPGAYGGHAATPYPGYAEMDPYGYQQTMQQPMAGSRYPPPAGRGMPFGAEKLCYRCHQPGHQALNCPRITQGGESLSSCFKCGAEGHMARDCDTCFVCKQRGHKAAACPDRGSGGDKY